jgi:hypothetical protein
MNKRKMKVFISMPFSGKKFENLYQERLDLKVLVESYGFELTEQFVGYQFKEDFESKDYDPKWVLGKDKNWLKQSDVVISDFTSYSIGTDFELVLCKEVFNKKVYAVVPEERRFHPWLKFYCERYFDSVEDTLKQIQIDFPNGPKDIPVDKRQYDAIAGEYRLVEETPVQKCVYDPNYSRQLTEVEVSDKRVVVLHAASGYRARIAKNLGAKEVLGVDLSYQNIRIAEDIEMYEPVGIHYTIADMYDDSFISNIPPRFVSGTDIVTGYFALDHAMSERELDAVVKNIAELLNEEGVFVGMCDHPVSTEPLSNKYGVVLSYDEKVEIQEEPRARRVSIYKDGKEVTHFHNFVWSKDRVLKAFKDNGFSEVVFETPQISEKDKAVYEQGFWNEYIENPDQLVLFARK